MKRKKTLGNKTGRRFRTQKRAEETAGKMECLCLECGLSNYLVLEGVSPEALGPSESKILANIFCDSCGGPLLVRGRAGDEPYYSID